MSMARRYSSVTHRPAILIFDPNGRIVVGAAGQGLAVFAGQRLPAQPPLREAEETGEAHDGAKG